jgi:hypothetical protein
MTLAEMDQKRINEEHRRLLDCLNGEVLPLLEGEHMAILKSTLIGRLEPIKDLLVGQST